MMVGSRLGYAASLLLAGPKHGAALRILDVRVAYEPQTLEREQIKVKRAPVNGDHNSELAISARHAGTVALQLLFREQNRNDPVARLWFDIEPPSMAVTGHSAELLFGLVTYLRLGEASLPAGIPKSDFMATGALDGDGNVGSVEAVATKINAALASNPSIGTRLFYPRADEAQVDEPLRQLCRDQGLLLCPVSRIDEALDSLGVPILGSWPSDLSPFRSLEAFDSRFSRVFFGRQSEVEQLLMLLDARAAAGKPGALIIGASGAGKSSFCLAGLIPALVKQKPGLRGAVWRPRDAASGDDNTPTDEAQLAENILSQWQARDESQNGLSLTLPAANPTTLDQLAKSLTTASADVQIFIVDQFEELFTLAFVPEARIAFARFLQQLQACGVWVIGTLRSEFYAQYLEMCDADGQPVLTPIFEGDGQYNLPRMSRDSFAQVIMRPADLAGLKFEQRPDGVTLAQSLLADAMSTEDALPLLGFALHWLYEQQGQSLPKGGKPEDYARTLRFADYERLGGLAGAIGTVAAQAYGALSPTAQKELPALLSALAVPSADGNRETARPAPLQLWPVGSAGRALIEALVKIRVLVSEDGITPEAPAHIRVAHEALFSHWELAAQILSESRQSRLLIEDFRQRAKLWDAEDRPKEALLSSPRDIANGRAVMPFVPVVDGNGPLVAFIESSIGRARRRRQIWFASAAAIALTLLGTTGWALVSADVARTAETKATRLAAAERDARKDAEDAAKKEKAAKDEAVLAQTNAEKAAKAEQGAKMQAQAAAVAEREQRAEADRQRDLALAATSAANEQRQFAESQTLEVKKQKSRAVALLAEQAIVGGDAMTGILLARSQLQPGDEENWSDAAQAALLHGISKNKEVSALNGHQGSLNSAVFSSDDMKLVTSSNDGTARVWTLNGPRPTPIVLQSQAFASRQDNAKDNGTNMRAVKGAIFGGDGESVLTRHADGIQRTWRLNSDRPAPSIVMENLEEETAAAYSPVSGYWVTGNVFQDALLWSRSNGTSASTILPNTRINMVKPVFSPDGKTLVIEDLTGRLDVWALDSEPRKMFELPLPQQTLNRELVFSPDGRHIIGLPLYGKSVSVWKVSNSIPKLFILREQDKNISNAIFSFDGQNVVTSTFNGSTKFWKLEDEGRNSIELDSVSMKNEVIYAISNDSKKILFSNRNGSMRVVNIEDPTFNNTIIEHEDIKKFSSFYFSIYTDSLVTISYDNFIHAWTFNGKLTSLSDKESNANSSERELISQYEKIPENGRSSEITQRGLKKPSLISAYFTSDRKTAVLGFADNTTRIHNLGPWPDRLKDFDRTEEIAVEIGSSDDGKRTAMISNKGRVWVWALDGKEPVWFTEVTNFDTIPTSAKFSRDYSHVLLLSESGDAYVGRIGEKYGRKLKVDKLDKKIKDAYFSPDNKRLLTTYQDGSAHIWTFSESPIMSFSLPTRGIPFKDIQFSSDGNHLAALMEDGKISIWNLPFGKELVSQSSAIVTRCLTDDQKGAAGIDIELRLVGLKCE